MMDKHTESDSSRRVEQALSEVFHAVTPNPSFVAELEQQLRTQMEQELSRHASVARQRLPSVAQESLLARLYSSLMQPFGQRRWVMAALVLLLAAMLTVAALGPQRVLAEFQRLVSYVPGLGFVELTQARILAAPVEVTRDGITVRVTQVLATPNGTEVVIVSDGLQELSRSSPFNGFEAYLLLPNRAALQSPQFQLGYREGTLHFPALPEGVYQVTLEFPRLPLVEEAGTETGATPPEGWRIPLSLLPASGELVESLFTPPYRPLGAEDSHEDITLRVVEVVHEAQETLLQVEMAWANPQWRFGETLDLRHSPQLQDNLGHLAFSKPANGYSVVQEAVVIEEEAAPTPTSPPIHSETIAFAPLSPSASSFRLWIEGVPFSTDVKESFTVDLGEAPQSGNSWPLDEHLTVAGLPIHLVGLSLHEQTKKGRTRYQLTFDMIAEKTSQGQLSELSLEIPVVDAIWGHGVLENDRRRIQADIYFFERLPDGPFTVEIVSAGFFIEGPWELSWQVPGTEESQSRVSPITLYPDAQGTNNDFVLFVQEMTMTDRLTAITVQVGALPAEMIFNGLRASSPVNKADKLYLSDNRGGRYSEQLSYLDWRPEIALGPRQLPEPNKAKLTWPKVDALAQRVTLHVPAVEAIWQEQATLEIAMPEEMRLQATGDGTFVSDPWPVEVPFDIAGYTINITEANLSRRDRTVRLELTIEQMPEQQNGRSLLGLQATKITTAEGHDIDLKYPDHYPYFISDDRTYMLFEFAMEPTLPIPPLIQIELEGAIVGVPGPWNLSWDVR